MVKITGKDRKVFNLFKDQIGSVIKVTDSAHKTAKKEVFDPFGKRQVDSDIWGGNVAATATLAGFTGHQQVDSAGLVHMGGRIYDPGLGRFLAADPFIQNPQNQQSLNRYSYVWNNPLTYTDPSGYFVKGLIRGIGAISQGVSNAFGRFSDWLAKNERMIYASAIKVAAIALAASTSGLGAWAIVSAGGYASGYAASNGNQRAATIGAITAVAFYGIGNGIDPGAVGLKTISHGVVSGAAASAQGGDFASNFAAGAVNGYLNSSRLIDTFTPEFESVYGTLGYQMATSAVAGGLTSQAISGNFESGFESALTAHVFNCVTLAWDVFNVGLSVKAISEWDDTTSYWEKALDVGALALDSAAAALPLVPGGAGTAVKGLRVGGRWNSKVRKSTNSTPNAQKLLAPPINITRSGLKHVLKRHGNSGIGNYVKKSQFGKGEDIESLIKAGTQIHMKATKRGHERVFNAGRTIGTDRHGNATSTIKIITKENGNLRTAYPWSP